ncbi:hypothetical protein Hamer_G002898 [Homarus americanus]|uniref:Uncharacterized protein n=1 Tax=Homarus americanus TaxID=6706 RepID=A0A8J5K288_HOMAM|nr:hypothetical protein Hamer_G002898 [Homarus americanus]
MAAHLLDSNEYTWPRRTPFITTKSKMVSASTIRKILSQEHFILLMTFYMRYTHLFADPKVALIMLVLSLFSDEPGLNDVDAVNLGRQHYLGLLSRYLTAVHGRQGGSEILRALLVSKEEARQLSDIHNHIELHNDIELSPQTRHNLRDMTDTLAVNFQLVCVSAKETILKARATNQTVQKRLSRLSQTVTRRHKHTKNLLARSMSVRPRRKQPWPATSFLHTFCIALQLIQR